MALETRGLRFRETMAGYMSPAGSFRAGYRWGKAAGGEVRFAATIAIPDLDTFLQDPEHRAALTASLDYDGLGWGLPVKVGRFHLFCRRDGHTRMLYYLPFTCSGQRYLLFGQKFVGDRPGPHVWRDLTSLHTQLLRLDESGQPAGEPLAKGILTIGLPAVVRQFSTFRTFGAGGPLEVLSLYARFLNGCTRELAEAYRLPLPNQRALLRFRVPPPERPRLRFHRRRSLPLHPDPAWSSPATTSPSTSSWRGRNSAAWSMSWTKSASTATWRPPAPTTPATLPRPATSG